MFSYFDLRGNSSDVVVKLLAWGGRGPGFNSHSRRYNFRDWLSHMFPSRDAAEIFLKQRISSKQPTNFDLGTKLRPIPWLWTVSSIFFLPWKYDLHWLHMHCDLELGDKILGKDHDMPTCHCQQLCEILSRSKVAVRNFGLDKDFGCVTFTLKIRLWIEVKTTIVKITSTFCTQIQHHSM